MIGYATLGTNNLGRAQAFYDALLAEIGAKRLMELPQGFTMYGVRLDRPALAITPPYDGKEAAPGNGNMLAIVLKDRAQVDALYQKALALGGSDEGKPGVRGEEGSQAFYAAYFRDPDGHKLCASGSVRRKHSRRTSINPLPLPLRRPLPKHLIDLRIDRVNRFGVGLAN
jgi:catechol 2,3-dioxygenase-like lactoylglutathione lyase family enzyme